MLKHPVGPDGVVQAPDAAKKAFHLRKLVRKAVRKARDFEVRKLKRKLKQVQDGGPGGAPGGGGRGGGRGGPWPLRAPGGHPSQGGLPDLVTV